MKMFTVLLHARGSLTVTPGIAYSDRMVAIEGHDALGQLIEKSVQCHARKPSGLMLEGEVTTSPFLSLKAKHNPASNAVLLRVILDRQILPQDPGTTFSFDGINFSPLISATSDVASLHNWQDGLILCEITGEAGGLTIRHGKGNNRMSWSLELSPTAIVVSRGKPAEVAPQDMEAPNGPANPDFPVYWEEPQEPARTKASVGRAQVPQGAEEPPHRAVANPGYPDFGT